MAGSAMGEKGKTRRVARRLLAMAGWAAVFPGSAIAPTRLPYSTASNTTVQTQPPPDGCHAIGTGVYSRPDPRCTPGALNPAVRQATIGRTICRAGWTATVRPRAPITEAEKQDSMLAYGDMRPIRNYEYDHFVPLELGGATNDPRNLWPEPGASPNPKDRAENELHRAVCERRVTLARAQQEIVANWVKIAGRGIGVSSAPEPRPQPRPPTPWCSARASWNSGHDDYDVYVHSNQPHQWASVTGAGTVAGYHTNGWGYADVYFDVSRSAAADWIRVQVADAYCATVL